MTTDTQDLVAFRLTGKHPSPGDTVARTGTVTGDEALRPVLFASYSDLTSLRYDFPVILAELPRPSASLQSLTDLMNDAVATLAPKGIAGEFERKQVLDLERQIRSYVAGGIKGTLSKLWKKAQVELVRAADQDDRKALKSCLDQARNLVEIDGEVVDCNEQACEKILQHVWTREVAIKAARFQKRVGALILRLERILEADFEISGQAQEPEVLEGAIGDAMASSFDFKALSDLLKGSDTHDDLPKTRTGRIENVLRALKTQRFFANGYLDTDERSHQPGGAKVHKYIFNSCGKAHDAFLDRLPEAVELVKAIAIAELEITNGYKPDFHDDFFAGYDQTSLMPEDLDLLPPCLALCHGEPWSTSEKGKIIEILSSGLPIKIVARTSDILTPSSVGAGPFAPGLSGTQLAGLAVGLGSAFVLQSSSSNLYRLRDELESGLAVPGPALFNVYSGQSEPAQANESGKFNLNGPYLTAAAAMEARAFPAFAFNPHAGKDLASRFCLLNNSAADTDWMTWSLDCEGDDLQRTTLELAFTFADFMAMDQRYRRHFVKVAKTDWVEEMVSVGDYLKLPADEAEDAVPYVLMINEYGEASRFAVDDTVIRATERIAESWRDLQEQGGINNSHAQSRLDEEREVWLAEKKSELEDLQTKLEAASAAALATSAQDVAVSPQPAALPAGDIAAEADPDTLADPPAEEQEEEAPVQSDDVWIETVRCTTCNECTDLNSQIFAYDDNMQAYVLDADCGPYKDVVEAAENCQVAIIHPGIPKDPNEPGLQDLIKRAELFT